MTPNLFITKLSDLNSVNEWLDSTPQETVIETFQAFTYDDLIALAESFENRTLYKGISLFDTVLNNKNDFNEEQNLYEMLLQNTFGRIISTCPDTFADLITSFEQLQKLSVSGFQILFILYDLTGEKLIKLIDNLEQLNGDFALMSFAMKSPQYLLKFIKTSQDLGTLPKFMVSYLCSKCTDDVAPLFKTAEEITSFEYQDSAAIIMLKKSQDLIKLFTKAEHIINPLKSAPDSQLMIVLLQHPQQVASLFKTAGQLIDLYQASPGFTNLLVTNASNSLVKLFRHSNTVVTTVQKCPELIMLLLITPEANTIRKLFTTAQSFIELAKVSEIVARTLVLDEAERTRIFGLFQDKTLLDELTKVNPGIGASVRDWKNLNSILKTDSLLKDPAYQNIFKEEPTYSRTNQHTFYQQAPTPTASKSSGSLWAVATMLVGASLAIVGLACDIFGLFLAGAILAAAAYVYYKSSDASEPSCTPNYA